MLRTSRRLVFTKYWFTVTNSRLAWTTPRLGFTTPRLIKTSSGLVKTNPGLVKTTLGLVKSKPGLVKAFGREITTAPLSHRTNCASQRHFFCREQAASVLLPRRKKTVHLSVKTQYLIPICHEENAHPTLARPVQPPLGTLQHQRHP